MESLKESYFFAQYKKEFGDKTVPDSSKLSKLMNNFVFLGLPLVFLSLDSVHFVCHLNYWELLSAI